MGEDIKGSPLVSIIMPAYNAGNFIMDSIQSVISQTYEYWELIIIDDGSTDETSTIIDGFLKTDRRIKYFFQPNSKQGKARNNGIRNSKGVLVAFLDADDMWIPEKLEIQVKELQKDSSISLVFSCGYSVENYDKNFYNVLLIEQWNQEHIPTFIESNRIPILSVLAYKSALEHVGNFTEQNELQNVEDYDLWLKLLFAGFKFKSTQHRLFYYRIHSEQSTFNQKNLNPVLVNLYCTFYQLYPKHVYTGFIVKRLLSFLSFPDLRPKVTYVFADWLRRNKIMYYALIPLSLIMPIEFQNKIYRRIFNYAFNS